MPFLKSIQASFNDPDKRTRALIIALLLCILLVLILSRVWDAMVLKHKTFANLTPNVQVVTAAHDNNKRHIILPGNIQAWHEAPIFARTDGYLKSWEVDIGAFVKKGDLLAVIETPELDAQLRQAEADLNVMIAKSKLANITAKRWINLLKTDSVSKQETDDKTHERDALNASVIAARANRDRLRELVSFERVVAPFTGIISARNTDIGDLINKGSRAEAKPLFRMVQSDLLRLYIKIPETYASQMQADMQVEFRLAERSEKTYQARLIHSADAIHTTSRTLLTQFLVHNQSGELLPGSYTQVDLIIPQAKNRVILPVNTLIFRREGLQVATIDQHQRVVLKDIGIATDYGTYVELSFGIKAGEKVIINPSDAIYQGQKVHVLEAIKGAKKSAA